ncbi:MAG TPA: carboxypeptidase-like regulatory domain-containing protein [Pyrinomonadaceae bacterium]
MPALLRCLAAVAVVAACVFLLCSAPRTQAQAAPTETPVGATGTVNGRVTTSDEKGLAGIVLSLLSGDIGPRRKSIARATTDGEGRYTINNVPAGRYTIVPFAPTYMFGSSERAWQSGKAVNIAPGEMVNDIDFTLTRGGVITGRITDAEGKPVIGQYVQAASVSEENGVHTTSYARPRATDDRGIYRHYGLAPGRYRISVGEDKDNMVFLGGAGRTHYARTFYPGVSEESQGKLVEVTSGGEATGIDITLGTRVKTYRVEGRVVDAETNLPVANARIMYGMLVNDSPNHVGATSGGQMSGARGEWKLEGIVPGRYALVAHLDNQSDMYGEQATFEVTEADVSNVVVKMQRGTSLSGVAVIEGGGDQAALARLSRLSIYIHPFEGGDAPGSFLTLTGRVNPNRSFYIGGIRPGKVRLGLLGTPETKGFTLVRVERANGVVPPDGIDLSSGTPATDVRLILAYGNAVVRGQVRIENGVLPANANMMVSGRRVGSEPGAGFVRASRVDARGAFVLDGLAAGEYELVLNVFVPNSGQQTHNLRQRVTVGSSGETSLTFVLDLKANAEERP